MVIVIKVKGIPVIVYKLSKTRKQFDRCPNVPKNPNFKLLSPSLPLVSVFQNSTSALGSSSNGVRTQGNSKSDSSRIFSGEFSQMGSQFSEWFPSVPASSVISSLFRIWDSKLLQSLSGEFSYGFSAISDISMVFRWNRRNSWISMRIFLMGFSLILLLLLEI